MTSKETSKEKDSEHPEEEKAKKLLGESFLEYVITKNYHGLETILSTYSKNIGAIEYKDEGGMTALAWSVKKGNYPITQELLRHGADPNTKDNDERRPLHDSISHGDTRILKLLLEHGADPTAKDKFGRTPLHLAAATATHNLEIHGVLLDHGASPLEKDHDQGTPLSIAKHLDRRGIQSLYQKHIKSKIKDKMGKKFTNTLEGEIEI
jgi:uncharacterized protein